MANPELATSAGVHAFLTGELDLVAEREHGGAWRTYFAGRVEWHPARSTRVVKVVLDHGGAPHRIQLCVSSDGNNSVFLTPPFERARLAAAIGHELAQLRALGRYCP